MHRGASSISVFYMPYCLVISPIYVKAAVCHYLKTESLCPSTYTKTENAVYIQGLFNRVMDQAVSMHYYTTPAS